MYNIGSAWSANIGGNIMEYLLDFPPFNEMFQQFIVQPLLSTILLSKYII